MAVPSAHLNTFSANACSRVWITAKARRLQLEYLGHAHTDGASIDDRVRLLQSDVTAAEHAARSMQGEPVEIVAAGGVRSSNATAFMSATPHLHSSCRIDQGPDLGELASLSSLKQK